MILLFITPNSNVGFLFIYLFVVVAAASLTFAAIFSFRAIFYFVIINV